MIAEPQEKRVFIVDDSVMIRALICSLVDRNSRLDLCGMAADGEVALAEIRRTLPDIVILDLDLPGLDGFSLLDAIHQHSHLMNVLVLSRSATEHSAASLTALLRGATACFDKAALVSHEEEFARLVEELGRGSVRPTDHDGHVVTLLN